MEDDFDFMDYIRQKRAQEKLNEEELNKAIVKGNKCLIIAKECMPDNIYDLYAERLQNAIREKSLDKIKSLLSTFESAYGPIESENKKGIKPLLKNTKFMKRAKGIAIKALCSALVLGTLVTGAVHINKYRQDIDDRESGYSETTTDEFVEEIIEPEVIYPLEELQLEIDHGTTLTSDSVRDLSNSCVKELEDLYILRNGDLPDVVTSENLSSLFFFENGCKTRDTEGDCVGIGQVSLPAIEDGVAKIEKLYNQITNNKTLTPEQQEILDNNYYIQNVLGKTPKEVWEKCKTDTKLCAAMSAGILASINDNFYTAYGENEDVIIMAYNAGVGNMSNIYIPNGIVNLSEDKKSITIDLSKVTILNAEQLEKLREAINYVIKIPNGAEALKESPKGDILDICEDIRVQIGNNDNSGVINTNQYNYSQEGVTFIGIQEYVAYSEYLKNNQSELER